MPLLHDHLPAFVKAQRPYKDKNEQDIWGSVHSTAMQEHAVAASALYNEVVMAEACEELGLACEPRSVTLGRRPVMDVAGVPHELICWTSRRSDQIAVCRAELEHGYVTAVDDDGTPRDVAATVFVMNGAGRFHRRHLLAETCRHFALVLRTAAAAASRAWTRRPRTPCSPRTAWTSASRRRCAACCSPPAA